MTCYLEVSKLNEKKGKTNSEINLTEALQRNRDEELQKIMQRKKRPEKFQKRD